MSHSEFLSLTILPSYNDYRDLGGTWRSAFKSKRKPLPMQEGAEKDSKVILCASWGVQGWAASTREPYESQPKHSVAPHWAPEWDFGTLLRLSGGTNHIPAPPKAVQMNQPSSSWGHPATTSRPPRLDPGYKDPICCCYSVSLRGAVKGARTHWNAWRSTLWRTTHPKKSIQTLWAETKTEEKKV